MEEQVVQLKALWKNKRALAFQALNLAMIIFSALMIWKALMIYTNSESPVVVVLTGSMEPGILRGDILFLDNTYEEPIRVGEVVVFKIDEREIPIVHRVLEVHVDKSGHQMMLTKGDNNNIDDRRGGIYARGQHWLHRDSIMGRARVFVPKVGMGKSLLHFTSNKDEVFIALDIHIQLKHGKEMLTNALYCNLRQNSIDALHACFDSQLQYC